MKSILIIVLIAISIYVYNLNSNYNKLIEINKTLDYKVSYLLSFNDELLNECSAYDVINGNTDGIITDEQNKQRIKDENSY